MFLDPAIKRFNSKHRKILRSNKTDFAACSIEERRTIISYLLNMINAGIAAQFTEEIFNFCVDVIGEKSAYALLKTASAAEIGANDIDNLYLWVSLNFRDRDIIRIMRTMFAPAVNALARKRLSGRNRELSHRLRVIRSTFGLTNAEMAILELFYFIKTHSAVSKYLASDPLDLRNYQSLQHYGDVILGLDRRQFRSVFRKSVLFDAKLVDVGDELTINSRINDYLLGVGDRELKHDYFSKGNDSKLLLPDFTISHEEMAVLKALLTGKAGCNILFYGEPGTGKTSLAISLAKHLKMDLYSVNIDEGDNEYGFRLQAICATLKAADARTAVIVVDEADELLNTMRSFIGPRSKNEVDKSWINNLLDRHEHKIIWIANDRSCIEQSTMRRFAFSVEFDKLTANNRVTILRHELNAHGLRNYFDESDLRQISKTYDVDASGIVNAVNLLKSERYADKGIAMKMVETVLKNHEKATKGEGSRKAKKDYREYSLEGLNTSHDLNHIILTMKNFARHVKQNKTISVSALLFGPPGTGKTEFVHYLGDQLGKDVVLKRASDIQDAYVGQTEKNIARAFREAHHDNCVLFFDEADSFFYPRKDAVRSWEKSFTNEILAQLDSFSGIVIFATNDKDGMDHAALRRFKFKIEFKPLTPEGNLHFYKTLLAPLAGNGVAMTAAELGLLKGLGHLTPGDFAVVKDQQLFNHKGRLEHQDLIAALMSEMRHKHLSKTIGF